MNDFRWVSKKIALKSAYENHYIDIKVKFKDLAWTVQVKAEANLFNMKFTLWPAHLSYLPRG